MPRDSGGNYTLPAGNPVVTGTIIESLWANDTMEDIAVQLNNVITRDGLLGPTQPFLVVDGNEALPGMAFGLSPSTGLYRFSPNVVGMSVGGDVQQIWKPDGIEVVNDAAFGGDLGVAGDAIFAQDLAVTGDVNVTGNLNVTGSITGGITIGGQILADDGTPALPSYSFASDPDIGMYRSGADLLGWAIGGIGVMGLSSQGRLALNGAFATTNGVTTVNSSNGANASTGFIAQNDAPVIAQFLMTSTGFTAYPLAGGQAGLLYAAGSGGLVINAAGVAGNIRFAAGGAVEQMRLTPGGFLGIGTDTPGVKVHAVGPVATARFRAQSSDVSGVIVELQADSSNSGGLGTTTNHPLDFFTNSGVRMRIANSGEVAIGINPLASVPLLVHVGANNNVELFEFSGGATIRGCTDAGVAAPFRVAGQVLVFSGDGGTTEAMRILANGNVGVGTVLPISKFMVADPTDARITLDGTTAGVGNGGNLLFYRAGVFKGSMGSQANRFGDNSDNLYIQSTAEIRFATGAGVGTEVMRISATGKVGIGIVAPTFLLDMQAAAAADSVWRMFNTGGGVSLFGQANGGTDGRFGTLTNHPVLLVTGGSSRVTIPFTVTSPILHTMNGIDYVTAIDPGATVGNIPIGAIVFGVATLPGASPALNGLGVFTASGANPLVWGPYTGGATTTTITSGTWRNIGAQAAGGVGLWMKVA